MRVPHLGDLHSVPGAGGEIYGLDSFGSLCRVLAAADSFQADLVLVTGDLVEAGDAASYGRVMVLSGHSHSEADARLRGPRVLTKPSTCAEAVHAPSSSCPDLEDFWASHSFNPSRQGCRTLDLQPDGSLASQVLWVGDAPVA